MLTVRRGKGGLILGHGHPAGRPLARLRRFAAEQQEVTWSRLRVVIKGRDAVGRGNRAFIGALCPSISLVPEECTNITNHVQIDVDQQHWCAVVPTAVQRFRRFKGSKVQGRIQVGNCAVKLSVSVEAPQCGFERTDPHYPFPSCGGFDRFNNRGARSRRKADCVLLMFL